MVLIITTIENKPLAKDIAKEFEQTSFISPTEPRAVHGAEKVIIIGDYPKIYKRYAGICPVEVVEVDDPEPEEEELESDES